MLESNKDNLYGFVFSCMVVFPLLCIGFTWIPKTHWILMAISALIFTFIVILNLLFIMVLVFNREDKEFNVLAGMMSTALVFYFAYQSLGLPSDWWYYILLLLVFLFFSGLLSAIYSINSINKLLASVLVIALIYYSPVLYGELGVTKELFLMYYRF